MGCDDSGAQAAPGEGGVLGVDGASDLVPELEPVPDGHADSWRCGKDWADARAAGPVGQRPGAGVGRGAQARRLDQIWLNSAMSG